MPTFSEQMSIEARPQSPIIPSTEPENVGMVQTESVQVLDMPVEQRIQQDPEFKRFLLERLKRRRDYAVRSIEHRYAEWDRVREHMSMYVNLDRKARRGDKTSDPDAREMPFQRSVVVPATYATLHVLLAQIMSIYAARKPMFQIFGVGPEDKLHAKIMEVLLDYDSRQTQAYSMIYSAFFDALQCGMGVVYDSWEIEEGNELKYVPLEVPGVPPDVLRAYLGPLAYTPVKQWTQKREYNRWRTIDPYRVRKDPRVSLANLQEGEFFGHEFDASYNYFAKRQMPSGPYFGLENIRKIQKSRNTKAEYKGYDGINDSAYEEQFSTGDEGYAEFYTCETMAVDLIPTDWRVGSSDRPEKWLFTWVEDKEIVRAHEMGNIHGMFPYSGLETDPDFHSSTSPGIGELIEGLQRVVNWLYNSHIENITSVLNNRWIYPSRFIDEVSFDYGGPGENVKLTNEAVDMMLTGEIQDIRNFLFQIPMTDVTGPSYLNALDKTYGFLQLLSGANDPLSAMPTPTERSATEIGTITAKATDRIAVVTKLMDEIGMQPLIKRGIHNRQQYTRIERYYRIAGDFARKLGIDNIFIDLMDIQGDFDYEPITGIIPEDPARAATSWSNLLAGAGQLPQLQQPGPDGTMLDFREIFKTIAEKMGVTDIDRFFVQVVPDEQAAQMAQSGQLLPVNPQPGGQEYQ